MSFCHIYYDMSFWSPFLLCNTCCSVLAQLHTECWTRHDEEKNDNCEFWISLWELVSQVALLRSPPSFCTVSTVSQDNAGTNLLTIRFRSGSGVDMVIFYFFFSLCFQMMFQMNKLSCTQCFIFSQDFMSLFFSTSGWGGVLCLMT